MCYYMCSYSMALYLILACAEVYIIIEEMDMKDFLEGIKHMTFEDI